MNIYSVNEVINERILHSCGFDSIPCDLAAFMVARAMRSRHGMGCSRLRNAVLEGEGGFSGGTLASGLHALTTEQENDAMKER